MDVMYRNVLYWTGESKLRWGEGGEETDRSVHELKEKLPSERTTYLLRSERTDCVLVTWLEICRHLLFIIWECCCGYRNMRGCCSSHFTVITYCCEMHASTYDSLLTFRNAVTLAHAAVRNLKPFRHAFLVHRHMANLGRYFGAVTIKWR
jgi:hypothetical protein